MNPLPKINGETGKECTYRVLKDNIMSLEFKPGQYLSEAEPAGRLDVSRSPISDVPMKLERNLASQKFAFRKTHTDLAKEFVIEIEKIRA